MECKNWGCCKEVIDLVLKVVFVDFFCWGVCNAVCCMKSCSSDKSCSTAQACSKTGAGDDVKKCEGKK